MTDFRGTLGAGGSTDLRAPGATDLRAGGGGVTDLRAGGGATDLREAGGGATDFREVLAFADDLSLFLGMGHGLGPAHRGGSVPHPRSVLYLRDFSEFR